jgi:hypothetical protein
MRLVCLPIVVLFACAGSSERSSREPDQAAVYPPEPVKGKDVDEDGKPLNPEIAACIDEIVDRNNSIGMAISGEKSSVDDRAISFGYCWCKSKGFRGQRTNLSCKP